MKCGNSIPNPKIPDVEERYGHGIFLEMWDKYKNSRGWNTTFGKQDMKIN